MWNVIAVSRKCREGMCWVFMFFCQTVIMGRRPPSDAAVHSRGTRNLILGELSLMMKIFRAEA